MKEKKNEKPNPGFKDLFSSPFPITTKIIYVVGLFSRAKRFIFTYGGYILHF